MSAQRQRLHLWCDFFLDLVLAALFGGLEFGFPSLQILDNHCATIDFQHAFAPEEGLSART